MAAHEKGESTSPKGRGPTIGPLTRRWKESLNEPPTALHLRIVRERFAINSDDESAEQLIIPQDRRQTLADLLCFCNEISALGGGIDWFKEIGERVDPKPRRIEISGPGGGPVRAAIGAVTDAERLAATEYHDRLSD